MNRASVFEWHKRFKEDRESVRDDERCGRSKEVRTPELIGQIKNFMDKDCRVSIETISAQFDVSVVTVHTIIREELKMWKICEKFVPWVLREDQKERRCHDSREMVELINLDLAVLVALGTCNESWIYCYDPETKRQSSQWKHAGSPRQSKSTHKPLMIPFFWQHWHDIHALEFYVCTINKSAHTETYWRNLVYTKDIWFDLVWFYGLSTIVGYLMPNPLYPYILNIYDLVLLAFKAYLLL